MPVPTYSTAAGFPMLTEQDKNFRRLCEAANAEDLSFSQPLRTPARCMAEAAFPSVKGREETSALPTKLLLLRLEREWTNNPSH